MISSILVFILVLSLLILAHELGHFVVARKAGIWVEEFGFGIPPRLISKKIGQTIYSLNLFPFGGFVRLHGENLEGDITDIKRAYLKKSKKTRLLVVVAGVMMNFLLAIVAFGVVYSFSGLPRETRVVKVIEVSSSSPAQVAGILPGDIVRSVDKKAVFTTKEFIAYVDAKKGQKVILAVQSGDEVKSVTLIPRSEPPENEGPLGVVISASEIFFPPFWQRPFYGAYYGFKEALFWGKTVVLGLAGYFKEIFGGRVPEGVSGPVGIFAVTTEAAKYGPLSLINFVGILSINLAILNILPFPALDGGRLLFIFLEGLIGKKILPKVEAAIHTAGMIILLALLLLITLGDIKRLIIAGSISGFLETMIK